ncbi:putative phosphatase [Vibrio sp. MACH09]|uniref:phosphatase n=1 Tax=unclassified Vibrio TaxID=2614977 RepID=UPI0014938691|nr:MULTISPECIES: phosphatase [unclassified Vibrio]NOI67517.1 phosphatase [Vibrio sp. 99-8-1]GLO63836.1 putative phosphatase [Vibrio sp. MACH09]
MNFAVDTHTHTYASGHAYSTLIENAASAKEHGLSLFCTTDHASTMPGAPHHWFFGNQSILPRFISGVGIVRGIESNILNIEGEVDVHPSIEARLDWVIASFHEHVYRPANKETHTETLINVIKSGRVDALGHLGNPNFDFDFVSVIQCAKEHNVAIEINNSSLKGHSRVGSVERCLKIAETAKEVGAYITTGSDAHFCMDIGKFAKVSDMLEQIAMPPSQIITYSARQFLDFLQLRGRTPIEEFADL